MSAWKPQKMIFFIFSVASHLDFQWKSHQTNFRNVVITTVMEQFFNLVSFIMEHLFLFVFSKLIKLYLAASQKAPGYHLPGDVEVDLKRKKKMKQRPEVHL